jgi:hypothetical protein
VTPGDSAGVGVADDTRTLDRPIAPDGLRQIDVPAAPTEQRPTPKKRAVTPKTALSKPAASRGPDNADDTNAVNGTNNPNGTNGASHAGGTRTRRPRPAGADAGVALPLLPAPTEPARDAQAVLPAPSGAPVAPRPVRQSAPRSTPSAPKRTARAAAPVTERLPATVTTGTTVTIGTVDRSDPTSLRIDPLDLPPESPASPELGELIGVEAPPTLTDRVQMVPSVDLLARARAARAQPLLQRQRRRPAAVVRRARNRPRVRRVTRVVRHVDTWSVFKVALVFNVFIFAVLLSAGVMLWQVAESTGTVDNIERFFESFGWQSFEFKPGEIYHNAWVGGLFLMVGFTGLAVLAATLFNLITDLVGGLRFTVLEEEVIARADRGTDSRRGRRLDLLAQRAASPTSGDTADGHIDNPDLGADAATDADATRARLRPTPPKAPRPSRRPPRRPADGHADDHAGNDVETAEARR